METLKILTDFELNAIVSFDDAFRFILSKDDLSKYDNGFVNWHKQSTLELSIVCEGKIDVHILGEKISLTAGDGFVIMPGTLHAFRSTDLTTPAKCITLIFHPEILYSFHGSYYENCYYLPILKQTTPCYFFSEKEPWTAPVFQQIRQIAEDASSASPKAYLKIQQRLQNLWITLAENLLLQESSSHPLANTEKILALTEFLHTHYRETFSLEKMAKSVSISKNECCRYFKKMMKMTITEYLLSYRLNIAKDLLETSCLSITTIAEQTGFCSVSYFIKIFHEKIGMTPKNYRKLRQMQIPH